MESLVAIWGDVLLTHSEWNIFQFGLAPIKETPAFGSSVSNQYATHSSANTRRRELFGPDCEPPEND